MSFFKDIFTSRPGRGKVVNGNLGNDSDRPAPRITSATAADNTQVTPLATADNAHSNGFVPKQKVAPDHDISNLFSENISAKIYRTASTLCKHLPEAFPEYVPQTGPTAGQYQIQDAVFWTCGFFPGTLYALLERTIKFPDQAFPFLSDSNYHHHHHPDLATFRQSLLKLCELWSVPLPAMAHRTDTHDIGFIIMPALVISHQLFPSNPCSPTSAIPSTAPSALPAIIQAATSLATRYIPTAGVIRSWDLLKQSTREILDPSTDAIIIIDSLCNLDLLYYAAAHTEDPNLASHLRHVATTHASSLLSTHLIPLPWPPSSGCSSSSSSSSEAKVPLYSTSHVAVLDPSTGHLKQRITHQGYSDTSVWSRGQSWAVLGYAQTYLWTGDEKFLWAGVGCAEYFLLRLREHGDLVPPWDFDAPPPGGSEEDAGEEVNGTSDDRKWGGGIPRDSSAGAIAANGMLVLYEGLLKKGGEVELAERMRDQAVRLVSGLVSPEEEGGALGGKARFSTGKEKIAVCDDEGPAGFDGILKWGTANWNRGATRKRYKDHGLVYGDYYLVEFGNKLLRLGLVGESSSKQGHGG